METNMEHPPSEKVSREVEDRHESWEQRFADFWLPLLTTDGKLDIEKVKNEMHDLDFIMRQVPKVYAHVTCDLLSKQMYDADTIIRVHDDRCHEYCVDKDDSEAEIADLKAELKKYEALSSPSGKGKEGR